MNVRLPWLVLSLLAAACSNSSSAVTPPILASAVIGPEGGVVVVTGGKQEGLQLSVPPGAIEAPREIRIVDVMSGVAPLSLQPQPGEPFAIEPRDLRLLQPASLRLPYRPHYVYQTSPSNVRVRRMAAAGPVYYDPDVVDTQGARVETRVSSLGVFEVVEGRTVDTLRDYWPVPGTSVQLADGWSLAVEEVPQPSPFAPAATERWLLTGPQGDERLYFGEGSLYGRESLAGNWREIWNDPYFVWQDSRVALPYGHTTLIQVNSPITQPPLGGQMTAYGYWSYALPRTVGDRYLLDIAVLRMSLAWERPDSGTGQQEYLFEFAAEFGLVAVTIDGVVHRRLSN